MQSFVNWRENVYLDFLHLQMNTGTILSFSEFELPFVAVYMPKLRTKTANTENGEGFPVVRKRKPRKIQLDSEDEELIDQVNVNENKPNDTSNKWSVWIKYKEYEPVLVLINPNSSIYSLKEEIRNHKELDFQVHKLFT